MTKYRVLKEFVDADGTYVYVDETFTNLSGEDDFKNALLYRGFIEEIKEAGRWRAEANEPFWYAHPEGCPIRTTDYGMKSDNSMYKAGNYFKSKATAQLVAEAQKLIYEWLHDTDAEAIYAIADGKLLELYKALNIARETVLLDDRSEA